MIPLKSHDVLLIEVDYTLVATIVVGAIIGGLSGKLVLLPEAK
ncbi:hypothetical protein SBA1_340004 [Candidatus Sulfotelmatobacter kueseliae]|uniref:Uncharacterized protein n=1 Tax=Candidatus Sulfotelmatobacter kueseliae TaxID=2042962 RepID=A0A2U3KMS1_9BACT|nr:hypothetical protein SBA1_340004 [Candidatus Sulfotelmatobacter kueseliae]